MRRALIITVEHQSAELSAQMVESLKHVKGENDLSLLIVRTGANSGVAGDTQFLCKSGENVWILEAAVNQGYFGGVNRGLEWFYKAQGDLPPWIIVCNNDIRIKQPDFFERLSQLDPSGVGVIAPKIVSSRTGLDQNPFIVRRPSRRRIGELRFWLKSYYLAFFHERMSQWKKAGISLKRKVSHGELEGTGPQPLTIYAPHGSFLVFSKQFFAHGGFLDEGFFLYNEEISVAEICRKIGLAIVYCPELCVLHDEHSTTGSRFTRSIYMRQRQSLQYLTSNYFADLVR